MKFIYCASLLMLLAACETYNKQAAPNNQMAPAGDGVDVTNKNQFINEIFRSYQFNDGIMKGLPGQGMDSIGTSQAQGYSFPSSSKVVIWHSISYVINGSGRLTIICADSSDYDIPVVKEAMAAVSSLMQSEAVRYDTANGRIYTYKTALRGF